MFSLLTKLSVCFWKILYGYKKIWNVICLIKTTVECPPILFEDCCICKTFFFFKYCKQTLSFTVGDEVKVHKHVQILIYLNGEKQIIKLIALSKHIIYSLWPPTEPTKLVSKTPASSPILLIKPNLIQSRQDKIEITRENGLLFSKYYNDLFSHRKDISLTLC